MNKQHGGKRAGAGAKKKVPANATRKSMLLTESEHEKVIELVKELRKQK